MKLLYRWQNYRYFPYERLLASRELQSLSSFQPIEHTDGLTLPVTENWKEIAHRSTYFSSVIADDGTIHVPLQAQLEASSNGNHAAKNGVAHAPVKRQSTRYSVHGLHEYRGKFNPQIVRAILNLLNVSPQATVLDPFCGSGTTLVECIHSDIHAIGFDLNPLAVFISNAKVKALSVKAEVLSKQLDKILYRFDAELRKFTLVDNDDPRLSYLGKWFDAHILLTIECLKTIIEDEAAANAPIFLTMVSDLLRDYSFQEPADLRIRRRRTPLPEKLLLTAFDEKARDFLRILKASQLVVGVPTTKSRATHCDSRYPVSGSNEKFDVGITSPPYATALPYIDTQRLSLIWLELCPPKELADLEARLTGSRELVKGKKVDTNAIVRENSYRLPMNIHALCVQLLNSLADTDGFRRKAVPFLLYRYFSDMQSIFENLTNIFKPKAPFALVVGHNHTVIGGQRFDIDTPQHLAEVASKCGWTHEESIPLQTYQRFDIHSSNAVKQETLLVLRRN